MSYQIKSTPFLQRMISTSKKNGQLQRLKEEYERIKDFNDRTIEMKMRQVRLKRLFREIEEIKVSSSHMGSKRRRLNKIKSSDEQRVENLTKARQLGNEISRMNALLSYRHVGRSEFLMSSVNAKATKAERDKKARSVKAISYGNEISRTNMQRISQESKQKKRKRELRSAYTDMDKKEKLKQRLNYGNSRSSINMSKIPKRHVRHKIATDSTDSIYPGSETMFNGEQFNTENLFVRETTLVKVYEDLLTKRMPFVEAQAQATQQPPKDTVDRRARALGHWRTVASTVHKGIADARSHSKPKLNRTSGSKENELRSISNDTHLPFSELSDMTFVMYADANDEFIPDEVLIKAESLQEEDRSAPAPTPTAPMSGSSSESVEPQVSQGLVKAYVDLFEPVVRESAQKEVYDYGLRKLLHIFEHKNDAQAEQQREYKTE